MSFSTDLAALVADQLSRFVSHRPHHLAGQVANLDFWLSQVRHAVAALDGYGVRFVRMDGEQRAHAARLGVTDSVPLHDGMRADITPRPPRRIPERELQKARRELLAAAERLLNCCRDKGLFSKTEWSNAVNSVGLDAE